MRCLSACLCPHNAPGVLFRRIRFQFLGCARPRCRGTAGLSTGQLGPHDAKGRLPVKVSGPAHPTPTPSARNEGLVDRAPAHEYPAPRSPSTNDVIVRPGSIWAASIQNDPPPLVVATYTAACAVPCGMATAGRRSRPHCVSSLRALRHGPLEMYDPVAE